jgi:DNA-binding transcriptional regulator YhcF (GntR family)
MKILPPRYTQVPNEILDNLHNLDRTEIALVMVLCRLTFGFHRHEVKASYALLAKKSGLAISTVMRATKRLEDLGFITHALNSNRAAVWSINVKEEEGTPEETGSPDEAKKTKQEPLYDKAQALAEVCRMDFESNRGMLLNQAKRLPLTAKEVLDLFGPGGPWYRYDFRGKKNSPPVLKQVFSEFKKLQQQELFVEETQESESPTKAVIKNGEIYL